MNQAAGRGHAPDGIDSRFDRFNGRIRRCGILANVLEQNGDTTQGKRLGARIDELPNHAATIAQARRSHM
jgi:hypothetical protein